MLLFGTNLVSNNSPKAPYQCPNVTFWTNLMHILVGFTHNERITKIPQILAIQNLHLNR